MKLISQNVWGQPTLFDNMNNLEQTSYLDINLALETPFLIYLNVFAMKYGRSSGH